MPICHTPSQRYFDWDNTVELHDLFNSESLQTRYGKFLISVSLTTFHRTFAELTKSIGASSKGLRESSLSALGSESRWDLAEVTGGLMSGCGLRKMMPKNHL